MICDDDAEVVERVANWFHENDFASPISEHYEWCTTPDCDLPDGYRDQAREVIKVMRGGVDHAE